MHWDLKELQRRGMQQEVKGVAEEIEVDGMGIRNRRRIQIMIRDMTLDGISSLA